MINHVRTLLINVAYESPPLYYGEEIVPRSFVPRKLGALSDAYTLFFGASPQREFLNFRVWQMLRIAHAMRDADTLLLQDDRVTYLPWRVDYASPDLTVPKVTTLSGNNQLSLFGNAQADPRRGRVRFVWQVEVSDASTVTITDQQTGQTEAVPLSGNAGLSDLILFGSGDLGFRLAYPATVGDKWQVDAFVLPPPDIAVAIRAWDEQIRSPSFPIWTTKFAGQYGLRERYEARHGLLDRFTISLPAWAAYIEEQGTA